MYVQNMSNNAGTVYIYSECKPRGRCSHIKYKPWRFNPQFLYEHLRMYTDILSVNHDTYIYLYSIVHVSDGTYLVLFVYYVRILTVRYGASLL
jgi:hypothetical protein